MSLSLKIVLTVAVSLLLAIVLLLVGKGDRGVADAHFWSGGDGDVARQVIMTSDGTLRRYSKPLVAAFLIGFVALMWLGFRGQELSSYRAA